MKILILSCNTGEGHNSAGRAVKEYLELQGHQVVMEDMMLLKGARTSKAVGGAYVGIVKHCPLLFGLGYRLGGWVSSDKRKSPVYYACSLLEGTLQRYLEQNRFDAIVTPHLYPAETLTAMKKKGWLKIPVVAIGTDYTCIPFWEETDCDYYVIPHEDLIDEFAKRGVPREKLLPWGDSGTLHGTAERLSPCAPGIATGGSGTMEFCTDSGCSGFGARLSVLSATERWKSHCGIVRGTAWAGTVLASGTVAGSPVPDLFPGDRD